MDSHSTFIHEESPAPAVTAPVGQLPMEMERALDRGPGESEGRYHNLGPIGRGGTSVVLAVEDRLLQRVIAVKRLLPEHRARLGPSFLREARVTASLCHAGVIPVYDFGEDSQGCPYMTLQRIQGEDLAARARREGPLGPGPRLDGALSNLIAATHTVEFAHQQGWIHRDLKPANLLAGPHGQLWVADWGISLHRSRWESPSSQIAGTLNYMSPEQAAGGPCDPRTDIYGLGACLFTLLTGRAPHGGDREHVLRRLRSGDPVSPPAFLGDIPHSLMELALLCLHPSPEGRPPSVAALRVALERARSGDWMLPQIDYAEGAVIVREGEPGDSAFLIVSGEVTVEKEGRIIRVMHADEVFGEIAPLLAGNRTSTVRARTAVRLAVLTRERLEAELALGSLGGRFVRALASRLASAQAPGVV
jgi:hypothetical protein